MRLAHQGGRWHGLVIRAAPEGPWDVATDEAQAVARRTKRNPWKKGIILRPTPEGWRSRLCPAGAKRRKNKRNRLPDSSYPTGFAPLHPWLQP